MKPPVVPVMGPKEEDFRDIYLHDVKMEQGQLLTAGTDGLVAVVRGSGQRPASARAKALRTASTFRLPQIQVRLDAGQQVEQTLNFLEDHGLG